MSPGPSTVVDGRFELVSELGRGGGGIVWLAHDRAHAGREVAVKILHPRLRGDPSSRTLFAREAETLMAISHPHIAEARACGVDGDVVYLAMERLEGVPLDLWIAQRGAEGQHLGPKTLISILSPLFSAIAHAHGKLIVHRDLKPQNIHVIGEGDTPTVKVLDFGLAKILANGFFEETTRGRRLGSVFYMAPEQLRGEPAEIRTDIFALGVLMFELTTLHRAFARAADGGLLRAFTGPLPSSPENGFAAVSQRILAEPRPSPSSIRPAVPGAVNAVIGRALIVDLDARYPTVLALARDALGALRAWDEGTPGRDRLGPAPRISAPLRSAEVRVPTVAADLTPSERQPSVGTVSGTMAAPLVLDLGPARAAIPDSATSPSLDRSRRVLAPAPRLTWSIVGMLSLVALSTAALVVGVGLWLAG